MLLATGDVLGEIAEFDLQRPAQQPWRGQTDVSELTVQLRVQCRCCRSQQMVGQSIEQRDSVGLTQQLRQRRLALTRAADHSYAWMLWAAATRSQKRVPVRDQVGYHPGHGYPVATARGKVNRDVSQSGLLILGFTDLGEPHPLLGGQILRRLGGDSRSDGGRRAPIRSRSWPISVDGVMSAA